MIKSMTGFGQGKYENEGREYTVEIKAVNHRYNDTSVRLPRYLSFLEDKIRKAVSTTLGRGKIEVYINLKNTSDKGRTVTLDDKLAGIYIKGLRKISLEYGIPDDITTTSIARMPDIITMENESLEDLYWQELSIALNEAIKNIDNVRQEEGKRLAVDIVNRLNKISEYVPIVEEKSANLLEDYKVKLENRIKELGATEFVDENRLGVEVVLFADKSSICEEVTRLKSHIEAFKSMIQSDGPIGKKIDFLIQEMNRETNTIGSKANSVEITKYVIEMKNEIENIREQIQNVE